MNTSLEFQKGYDWATREAQTAINELRDMLEWTTENDEVYQFQRRDEIRDLVTKYKGE